MLDKKKQSVRANMYSWSESKCLLDENTPLYEKDIKQNQNKPMETTKPSADF